MAFRQAKLRVKWRQFKSLDVIKCVVASTTITFLSGNPWVVRQTLLTRVLLKAFLD